MKKCAECKGECCKRMPGCIDPQDLGNLQSQIMAQVKRLIGTGKYYFNYWEGDYPGAEGKTAYYLMPAVQGEEDLVVKGTWGGPCTFLTDTGCTLQYNDRPKECRSLNPTEDECRCDWNKDDAIKAWLPYLDKVKMVITELKEIKYEYDKNNQNRM
jgi:hypothetical protein